ncbi:MAG TPA: alpha/beta hydrolase [Rhizomicrobium sp.]|nr:alpha/beta hydrolase [Rhizomicrobium sp.]
MLRLFTLLKCAGLALLGLCALGLVYQLAGDAYDARYAPPATEMISVDGYAIHFVCTGRGRRTYLLDSGATVGAFSWDYVAPLLARRARVCAFDRPGLGWSEDTGDAHDVRALAERIARIVRAARLPRPFIYVGHSLGADDAIVYYGLRPRDVAALVLLEPGIPGDILRKFHGTRAEAMAAPDCDIRCNLAEAAAYLGVTRFFVQISGIGRGAGNTRMGTEYLAQLVRPAQARAFAATLETTTKSAFEMSDVKSFGDTPVLVLTSSRPHERGRHETPAQYQAWRNEQLAWYAALARMSTRGMGPVIIPGTDHAGMVVTKNGAAKVAAAITDFLDRQHVN